MFYKCSVGSRNVLKPDVGSGIVNMFMRTALEIWRYGSSGCQTTKSEWFVPVMPVFLPLLSSIIHLMSASFVVIWPHVSVINKQLTKLNLAVNTSLVVMVGQFLLGSHQSGTSPPSSPSWDLPACVQSSREYPICVCQAAMLKFVCPRSYQEIHFYNSLHSKCCVSFTAIPGWCSLCARASGTSSSRVLIENLVRGLSAQIARQ